MTADDIVSFHSDNGAVQLSRDDIIVQDFNINWCNKERDPAENISYYKTGALDESKFHLHQSKVAQLLPTHFQERIVRVFLRDKNDFGKLTASSAALRKFLRHKERNVSDISKTNGQSNDFTGPHKRQVSQTPHHLSRIHLSPSRPRRSATISGVSNFRKKSLLSGTKYVNNFLCVCVFDQQQQNIKFTSGTL